MILERLFLTRPLTASKNVNIVSHPFIDNNYYEAKITMQSTEAAKVDDVYGYSICQLPATNMVHYDKDFLGNALSAIEEIINGPDDNQLKQPLINAYKVSWRFHRFSFGLFFFFFFFAVCHPFISVSKFREKKICLPLNLLYLINTGNRIFLLEHISVYVESIFPLRFLVECENVSNFFQSIFSE